VKPDEVEITDPHTTNDQRHDQAGLMKKGGGAVIYSCLPLSKREAFKAPLVMSFEKNYPIPLKAKVIANMKRWGFT
jgi:hypothetical protein